HYDRNNLGLDRHQPLGDQLDREPLRIWRRRSSRSLRRLRYRPSPGQTQSLLVAGLAPRQNSVAVQVSSSVGPVAADLQQHRLDGIVPAGVDTLHPATARSNVVVPALQIPGDAEHIADESGLDGQSPTLHVTSIGSAVSPTITLRGPDGPVDVTTEASAIELAPGASTTVDLSGVEPGT